EMLISAAAAEWGVSRGACRAERGFVVHDGSSRKLSYGRLAARASRLPVPKNPPWKERVEHRLLGTRVARVDGPDIVTGRAVSGLDAALPGWLMAAVARCPVPGGKLGRVDDAKARTVPGVKRVVTIPTGVAVVADTTWAALEGRDALAVTWDEGANASLDTAALWQRLRARRRPPAQSTRQADD